MCHLLCHTLNTTWGTKVSHSRVPEKTKGTLVQRKLSSLVWSLGWRICGCSKAKFVNQASGLKVLPKGREGLQMNFASQEVGISHSSHMRTMFFLSDGGVSDGAGK